MYKVTDFSSNVVNYEDIPFLMEWNKENGVQTFLGLQRCLKCEWKIHIK